MLWQLAWYHCPQVSHATPFCSQVTVLSHVPQGYLDRFDAEERSVLLFSDRVEIWNSEKFVLTIMSGLWWGGNQVKTYSSWFHGSRIWSCWADVYVCWLKKCENRVRVLLLAGSSLLCGRNSGRSCSRSVKFVDRRSVFWGFDERQKFVVTVN